LPRRSVLAAIVAVLHGCARRDEAPAAQQQTAPAPSQSARPKPASAASSSASAPSAASSASAPAPAGSFDRPPGDDRVNISTVFVDAAHGGPQWVRIARPAWDAGAGLPLLVALHGLGESQKGREPGSWGWIKDYKLERAMLALRGGVLKPAHFQGFVDGARLSRINKSLRKRPFRGVVVACPYTPDRPGDRSLQAVDFAELLVDRLLPQVRAETGVLGGAACTGLDGISLGGRLSLLVALARPAAFGAVGSMQTALDATEVKELAGKLAAAFGAGGPRLRLLTSEQDFYREAAAALHAELRTVGLAHQYLRVPGPHAYAFNRGPGAIEMLLWHDRVLRGEDSV
jgi:hypothetical protein